MKAKIRIYTFPKGSHQGSCLPVAVCDMEITRRTEQTISRQGCCSAEIVLASDTPTVVIAGRKFICDEPRTPFSDDPTKVDFQVAIPWDLAEKITVCPHCKALL